MIDEKTLELIHGEIDGENSETQSEDLRRHLETSPEARELLTEMRQLRGAFDSIRPADPPPGLREAILSSLAPAKEQGFLAGFLQGVIGALQSPATMRYGGAFALGIVATMIAGQIGTPRGGADLDISQLTGTMARHEALPVASAGEVVQLDLDEVSGSVSLHPSGSMLVIQFDLESRQPVEIVAGYQGSDVGFNGFIQVGNEVSAEVSDGRVTMTNEGEHSFAVFLGNRKQAATTVDLKFFAGGELIHEDKLQSPAME